MLMITKCFCTNIVQSKFHVLGHILSSPRPYSYKSIRIVVVSTDLHILIRVMKLIFISYPITIWGNTFFNFYKVKYLLQSRVNIFAAAFTNPSSWAVCVITGEPQQLWTFKSRVVLKATPMEQQKLVSTRQEKDENMQDTSFLSG